MSLGLPSYAGAIPTNGDPKVREEAIKAHAAYELTMNILNGYIDADTLSVAEIASLDAKYPEWKTQARDFALIRAEKKF